MARKKKANRSTPKRVDFSQTNSLNTFGQSPAMDLKEVKVQIGNRSIKEMYPDDTILSKRLLVNAATMKMIDLPSVSNRKQTARKTVHSKPFAPIHLFDNNSHSMPTTSGSKLARKKDLIAQQRKDMAKKSYAKELSTLPPKRPKLLLNSTTNGGTHSINRAQGSEVVNGKPFSATTEYTPAEIYKKIEDQLEKKRLQSLPKKVPSKKVESKTPDTLTKSEILQKKILSADKGCTVGELLKNCNQNSHKPVEKVSGQNNNNEEAIKAEQPVLKPKKETEQKLLVTESKTAEKLYENDKFTEKIEKKLDNIVSELKTLKNPYYVYTKHVDVSVKNPVEQTDKDKNVTIVSNLENVHQNVADNEKTVSKSVLLIPPVSVKNPPSDSSKQSDDAISQIVKSQEIKTTINKDETKSVKEQGGTITNGHNTAGNKNNASDIDKSAIQKDIGLPPKAPDATPKNDTNPQAVITPILAPKTVATPKVDLTPKADSNPKDDSNSKSETTPEAKNHPHPEKASNVNNNPVTENAPKRDNIPAANITPKITHQTETTPKIDIIPQAKATPKDDSGFKTGTSSKDDTKAPVAVTPKDTTNLLNEITPKGDINPPDEITPKGDANPQAKTIPKDSIITQANTSPKVDVVPIAKSIPQLVGSKDETTSKVEVSKIPDVSIKADNNTASTPINPTKSDENKVVHISNTAINNSQTLKSHSIEKMESTTVEPKPQKEKQFQTILLTTAKVPLQITNDKPGIYGKNDLYKPNDKPKDIQTNQILNTIQHEKETDLSEPIVMSDSPQGNELPEDSKKSSPNSIEVLTADKKESIVKPHKNMVKLVELPKEDHQDNGVTCNHAKGKEVIATPNIPIKIIPKPDVIIDKELPKAQVKVSEPQVAMEVDPVHSVAAVVTDAIQKQTNPVKDPSNKVAEPVLPEEPVKTTLVTPVCEAEKENKEKSTTAAPEKENHEDKPIKIENYSPFKATALVRTTTNRTEPKILKKYPAKKGIETVIKNLKKKEALFISDKRALEKPSLKRTGDPVYDEEPKKIRISDIERDIKMSRVEGISSDEADDVPAKQSKEFGMQTTRVCTCDAEKFKKEIQKYVAEAVKKEMLLMEKLQYKSEECIRLREKCESVEKNFKRWIDFAHKLQAKVKKVAQQNEAFKASLGKDLRKIDAFVQTSEPWPTKTEVSAAKTATTGPPRPTTSTHKSPETKVYQTQATNSKPRSSDVIDLTNENESSLPKQHNSVQEALQKLLQPGGGRQLMNNPIKQIQQQQKSMQQNIQQQQQQQHNIQQQKQQQSQQRQQQQQQQQQQQHRQQQQQKLLQQTVVGAPIFSPAMRQNPNMCEKSRPTRDPGSHMPEGNNMRSTGPGHTVHYHGNNSTATLASQAVQLLASTKPTSQVQQVHSPYPPLPQAGSGSLAPKHLPKDAPMGPPKLILGIKKNKGVIVLSWRNEDPVFTNHAMVACYELYAHQESQHQANRDWRKIGSESIAAMPLPMACTLTQFSHGSTYYFTVRGKDVYGRYGPFSKPCSSADVKD